MRSSKESCGDLFGRVLASPLIWGTLVVNFCYNYFTFFCMTWMPSYLVEQRGLSLSEMGCTRSTASPGSRSSRSSQVGR